jgi:hypothetical protein
VFWPVMVANALMAIVGDVFGPAVAALTLGLFCHEVLARRMGRNSAFDHAGNVAIAAVAGAVGWAFSQRAVFLLVPVFAVLAAAAVMSIPARAIDHQRAREADTTSALPSSDSGDPLHLVRKQRLVDRRPVARRRRAGIFGAITPLVVADLMRGTGRYNVAQGAVATVQGIGASSSGLVAGVVVDHFGYTAAFVEAAVAASVAFRGPRCADARDYRYPCRDR